MLKLGRLERKDQSFLHRQSSRVKIAFQTNHHKIVERLLYGENQYAGVIEILFMMHTADPETFTTCGPLGA